MATNQRGSVFRTDLASQQQCFSRVAPCPTVEALTQVAIRKTPDNNKGHKVSTAANALRSVMEKQSLSRSRVE